jgi:hypothetical protein
MTRRRRRVLTVGAVCVVVALALLTARIVGLSIKIVGPQSDVEPAAGLADRPFGAFAGYVWAGPVTSVSATFTVPTVVSGSPLGVAGTWIGAQRLAAPNHFVQIGVTEERLESRSGKVVVGYHAFWSDVGRHFTSGRRARFSIGSETEAPFDQAEWLQEDPGAEHNHVEYPRLTVPTFRHLTVNAFPPSPGSPDVFSAWMSANSGTLGATGLLDDSFTLEREPAVDALAGQYLRLTEAARVAATSFASQFSNWNADTPYAHVHDATSRYIEATRAADHALLAAPWPRQIRRLVRASVQATAVLVATAQPPVTITAATFAHWNSGLTEASLRARRVTRPLLLMLRQPTYL